MCICTGLNFVLSLFSDLSRVEGPSQDFQIASEHHGEQLQRSLQSLKRVCVVCIYLAVLYMRCV